MDKLEQANREKLLANAKTVGDVVINDKNDLQGKKVDNTATVNHEAGMRPEHKEVPAGTVTIEDGGKKVEQKVEQKVDTTPAAEADKNPEKSDDEPEGPESPILETEQFDDDGPKDKETPDWAKKRFSKLTAQREEAKRLAEEQKARAEYWENVARQGTQPKPEAPAPAEAAKDTNAPPKAEDFDTYDKYIDAQVEYRMKQLDKTNAQQKVLQQRDAKYVEKAIAFKKEHADFDEAAQSLNPYSSPILVDAIKSVEFGPNVTYYLAKHREEVLRIINLHPVEQVIAIKELNDKFKVTPKKVSQAKEPLKKIDGEPAGVKKDLGSMTLQEYAEERKEALAWKRPRR